MKTTIHVFGLMILVCMAGCRKGEDEVTGPLLIPQEVKDYMYFEPGTYWVYIDSVSGRVDSVYVYQTTHSFDTLTLGKNPKRAYEIFVVKAHSEMDGYDYYFEVNTTYSANDNSIFNLFKEKLKPGHYVGQTVLFNYKPIKGQIFYEANATKTIIDIYNSFNLSGRIFYDVVQVYQDLSVIEVSNHANCFFSKNYGLIRKELADSNQVWNLVRSNIIQ